MTQNLENITNTNVLTPNLPVVSAYFVDQTSAGGAYGLASAAEVQNLLYTVNALVDAMITRKAIAAS